MTILAGIGIFLFGVAVGGAVNIPKHSHEKIF